MQKREEESSSRNQVLEPRPGLARKSFADWAKACYTPRSFRTKGKEKLMRHFCAERTGTVRGVLASLCLAGLLGSLLLSGCKSSAPAPTPTRTPGIVLVTPTVLLSSPVPPTEPPASVSPTAVQPAAATPTPTATAVQPTAAPSTPVPQGTTAPYPMGPTRTPGVYPPPSP